jgi:Na+/proline symporter
MAISSAVIGVWASLLGMSIYTINPTLVDQEQAMIWVVQHVLNGSVAILVTAAIIAAIVSSADSALHSASSCLTRDIYHMVLKPKASEKEILIVSKISIVFVGVTGVAIGIAAPNVLEALLLGYSMSAAGLFFPLLIGHYWKGATRLGAIVGIVGGAFFTLFFKLMGTPFDYLPAVFWGLLISLLGIILFSYTPIKIRNVEEH